MKMGRPVILTASDYEKLRRAIVDILFDVVYLPLAKAAKIGQKQLENEIKSPLYTAIRSGKIYYEDKRFQGEFNAATSKELREMGANYQPSTKSFYYSGIMPFEIGSAIAIAAQNYKALTSQVLSVLDGIDINEINRYTGISDAIYDATGKLDRDIKKSLKAITITPELTEAQRNVLTADWAQNMDLYVKNWAQEQITEMRALVMQEVFKGKRVERIADIIAKSYGQTKNKAQFLARQETSLLLSKMKEQEYKDAGSTQYIWSGAMDEREREDHKALEGKVISWNNPPVVDRRTGRRAHAGEDFGCRCVAIPVFD